MHESTCLYFKIALATNLISAIFNVINDCDETYNYWEPLHFLSTFGKGGGFQTWEYAPQYSLRSYLYLWIFGWPALLFGYLEFSNWFGFFAVRIYLALFSSIATTFLSVCLTKHLVHPRIKHQTLFGFIFTLVYSLAPGTFLASTTLLPSGPCAGLVSMMLGFWIRKSFFCAVGCVAIMGLIVWPFAAAIGLPLAFYLIYNKKFLLLLKYSIIWKLLLIPTLVCVDSFYFGRFTLAPFNIIMYNIFSNGFMGKSSSQLYGTEPISFYLKNYILNHNISSGTALILICLTPFILLKRICCIQSDESKKNLQNCKFTIYSLIFIVFSCLIVWNGIFFNQDHKEERFLFPCYPCLAVSSTIFLWSIFNWILNCNRAFFKFILIAFILVFSLIFLTMSLFRTVHLIRWYSSPNYLIRHLPKISEKRTLCLARDWHLFPSRFFLPSNVELWKIQFLRSNFSGQLPGQFTPVHRSSVVHSTSTNGSLFNAENVEEPDRFSLNGASDCDYILDHDSPVGLREELYVTDASKWVSILNRSMLDLRVCDFYTLSAFQSRIVCTFLKSFYLPILSERMNNHTHMHLLGKVYSIV